jgi:acetyl esterase/lipase
VPRLEQITDQGDTVGQSFSLQIQVQYNGGGFTTVIEDTVSGRTGDPYQKAYLVNLSGTFPVDVRIVRITADSSDLRLANEFSWTSYTELIYTRLSYPNSALVGIRIDAEQFSNIPQRSYLVRGVKVRIPNNATVDQANGRLVYSGIWNGTFGAAQWCSDPAWILWDLLTSSRYGFGEHLDTTQLDKFSFFSASQYCSTLLPSGSSETGSATAITPVLNADQVYTTISGVSANLLSLDIYHFGTGTAENRPVIIYIHGGAWAVGDKANVDSKASFYNDLGYIFVSLNYRLSPSIVIPYASFNPSRVKHPNHITDCAAAIGWVYGNIGNYGGDENKLILSGHSAGAQLASLLATNQSYLSAVGVTINKIKGCISVDTEGYDIYKQISEVVDGGEGSTSQQKYIYQNAFGIYPDASVAGTPTTLTIDFANTSAALASYTTASPISHVSATTPSFLVFTRGDAIRVTRAGEFTTVLQAATVPTTFITYPGNVTYTHSEINKSIGSINDPPTGKSLPTGVANVTTQIQNWLASIAATTPPPVIATNGLEPRFSCNVNIQTSEEAYKLINDMCSVFRAMPYWAVGSLTVSQDKPVDPSYLFTLANVSEEGFSYSGSSLKTRPNVAVVSYMDLSLRDMAYEVVEDAESIAKYGVVKTEISAFACTSRGQARRIGEWLLYSERYEGETVTFSTSVDAGVIVRPGQVISVADPVKAGARRGGRISSATTTAITVDDATGLATPGTISAILPDGTVELRTVQSIAGAVITVTSAFTTAPNVNSVWVYETTNIQTSTWRVLGIAEQDGSKYAITALSYNASKYDYIERDQPLQERDISDLGIVPAAPNNLSAVELLYDAGGIAKSKLVVDWDNVEGVQQYRIRWRPRNGNWTDERIKRLDYEIIDTLPGIYEIEVYAIGANLRASVQPAFLTQQTFGKTAPPANVENVSLIPGDQLSGVLTWDRSTDLDVLLGGKVLIRHSAAMTGATWEQSQEIVAAAAGSQTQKQVPMLEGTYLLKFEDDTGNRSTAANSIVADFPEPQPRSLFKQYAEDQETPPFNGSFAGLFYSAEYNGLLLDSSQLVDDMAPDGNWDALTVLDAVGGVNPLGEYSFEDTWDMGAVYDVNLRRHVTSQPLAVSSFWDDKVQLIDEWPLIDEDNIDTVNAALYVRTTADDPAGTPVYGDWNEFANVIARGRGFQFKVRATSSDPDTSIIIDELGCLMELQLHTEQSGTLASGAGAYAVVFDNAFYQPPNVGVTGFNMATGDFFTVTSVTRTGFTVEFKNSTGTSVNRNFTYTAVGYGREV